MNKQEELELWKRWKAGDTKAQNDLIRSMQPLLSSQVNRFVKSGLPKSSIDTESKRLAMEAFKTYDPEKSALNTHVVNHQKHLQRFVLNYQNIGRIPENRGLLISKYSNIKRNMSEELDREPTTAELAKELKWSVAEVTRMGSELRKDLSMSSRDEDDFFDDILSNVDVTKDIIHFIYYESDPIDKLIIEYWFGVGGKEKLINTNIKDISAKIGKPDFYIRRRVKALAEKINDIRNRGLY